MPIYTRVKAGDSYKLNIGFENTDIGVSSPAVVLCNMYKAKVTSAAFWEDIKAVNNVHTGIVYVVSAYSGSSAFTYVGKTLNTMAIRYPAGPNGGLGLVFAQNTKSLESMRCVLINTGNPTAMEGMLYQYMLKGGHKLTNMQDPN